MILNKETILKILLSHKAELKQFGLKRIGLFGSYVRGDASIDSDIDFIVEFEKEKKTFDNFMDIAFFLEDLFGKKIDLLTQASLSPYIKPYVENEVVYETI